MRPPPPLPKIITVADARYVCWCVYVCVWLGGLYTFLLLTDPSEALFHCSLLFGIVRYALLRVGVGLGGTEKLWHVYIRKVTVSFFRSVSRAMPCAKEGHLVSYSKEHYSQLQLGLLLISVVQ